MDSVIRIYVYNIMSKTRKRYNHKRGGSFDRRSSQIRKRVAWGAKEEVIEFEKYYTEQYIADWNLRNKTYYTKKRDTLLEKNIELDQQ